MIDRIKIHNIVEFIRRFNFEFEVVEVEDELQLILNYYDFIDIELTSEERCLLVDELIPLAEQFEFREAQHLAFEQEPLLTV
ncbi:hypothetical protein ISS05_04815 [Candidatus Woesearchaeota archaeon]|nr:hypothetical protein [Candidatus Woesearchaeota archaeon]